MRRARGWSGSHDQAPRSRGKLAGPCCYLATQMERLSSCRRGEIGIRGGFGSYWTLILGRGESMRVRILSSAFSQNAIAVYMLRE